MEILDGYSMRIVVIENQTRQEYQQLIDELYWEKPYVLLNTYYVVKDGKSKSILYFVDGDYIPDKLRKYAKKP